MSNPGLRHRMMGNKLGQTKLTEEQVREIRRLRAEGKTLAVLATQFDISSASVSDICLRKLWKHVE